MPDRFATRPELVGHFGMVSSTHWLASAAGMRILERGGNAFDAAVAAGLTLQVVEPHLNGPGGDLPILIRSSAEDRVRVICGQGVAPATASLAAFGRLGLELVPGTGLLPACVPGAFDAWMLMLRDHGTCSLDEVFEPALEYAEKGTPIVPLLAATLASVEDLFRDHWHSSFELYFGKGASALVGFVRNPELAATYRRLVREANGGGGSREARIDRARDVFYRGFVAEAIDVFVAAEPVRDSSGRDHRGFLTAADMAAWSATYEEPLRFDYRGHEFWKTDAWGQGPVLLQQLALLEGFDLRAMGHNSAEYIHTVVECAKLAFADREAWYGDPNFVEVPVARLLDPRYAEERRRLVADEASAELRPGSPAGVEPRLPSGPMGTVGDAGVGEPSAGPRGDTCHVDVVDRDGNMVAATPSGGWLQSSPAIPGLGFPLGTRGQMFWLTDGHPNSLAPGKRPRTTLSPNLATIDGEPRMAFGTPGGDQQDQWSLNFLLGRVEFGLDLQSAIDAPQFHSLNSPSSFYPRERHPARIEIERRVGPAVIAELRERGHDVQVTGDWKLGRLCAVWRGADGVLRAGASPRGMQEYATGR